MTLLCWQPMKGVSAQSVNVSRWYSHIAGLAGPRYVRIYLSFPNSFVSQTHPVLVSKVYFRSDCSMPCRVVTMCLPLERC